MVTKSKQQQLDEIRQKMIDDDPIPALKAGATQPVFGAGRADAEIVMIGEAPGKKEDETGLPFVGAAGKFLDQMLEMIKLKREDVYITNIVKYRPPNNRDPFPDEKEAFLPYLEAQLDVIQPKLTITLGRHSLNCFLPDLSISQVHGQPKRIRLQVTGDRLRSDKAGDQDVDGVQGSKEKRTSRTNGTVSESRTKLTQQSATKLGRAAGSASRQGELVLVILPLFHPAAALYNGSMKQTLIDDFAKIPLILKKLATQ